MVMIRTLRRVPSVLPLTRWLTHATAGIFIVVPFAIVLAGVDNAVHVAIALAIRQVIVHAETRPTACTATLTLVMARKRVPTSKSAATFEASVWPLASVQFRMAFQIVQTAETRLAGRTFVWLFLTVGQKMALEVVVPCEISRAVWALVAFRRW